MRPLARGRETSLPMSLVKLSVTLLFCLLNLSAFAQDSRVYTDKDYAQAEKFMPYNVNGLVLHAVEDPTWLPDGRVWYRDHGTRGTSFILVDPAKRTKAPAFDQAKLAAALQPLAGTVTLDPNQLPITDFRLSHDDQTVEVSGLSEKIVCDLSGQGICRPDSTLQAGVPGRRHRSRSSAGGTEISPDGRKAAFIRDWNLWVRDLASAQRDPADHRMASRTTATPPTTPAGPTPIIPSSSGRPIRNASRPSSRTSARPARCI